MLERLWRKGNPSALLVGLQTGAATVENSIELLGDFNTAPQSAMDEEKDYQDMICLGRKGGRF